jgi:hypothetical protein
VERISLSLFGDENMDMVSFDMSRVFGCSNYEIGLSKNLLLL